MTDPFMIHTPVPRNIPKLHAVGIAKGQVFFPQLRGSQGSGLFGLTRFPQSLNFDGPILIVGVIHHAVGHEDVGPTIAIKIGH